MSRSEILVLPDVDEVARAGAERFLAAARESIRDRGRFVVALAGGSTPRLLYRLLASGPLRPMLPWSRTHVFFGDERCVPPDHADSNYGMALATLLDHVRIPPGQVHRIRGELEPEPAAEAYERELRETFQGAPTPRLDCVLLGVGEDGHTASLFPGGPELEETRRWVVASRHPKSGADRVTLTPPVFRAARRLYFLVTGSHKARVLLEAFGGAGNRERHPCGRIVPTDGVREILVDADAGALLRVDR